MKRLTLALLLALSPTFAAAQPRHIYRDGNYFFCPNPDFDPYCSLPNDYSAALYPRPGIGPPEGRPGPPVMVMPGLPPGLAAHANRAIQNALRPRYSSPAGTKYGAGSRARLIARARSTATDGRTTVFVIGNKISDSKAGMAGVAWPARQGEARRGRAWRGRYGTPRTTPSYYQAPNKSEPQPNVVKAKQPPLRTGVSTRTAQFQVTPARPVSHVGPTGPTIHIRRGR